MEIVEAGKDRVSFDYNGFMGRANMFYGGLQTLKTDRRYRKHYSHDGSMEITYDKTTQKATFVTYIGGDGYSAPVIWRSEQTTTTVEDYYFLHRDYLGSILGITDRNGTFKEKRHFDAWGNLTKFSNDTGATTPPSGAGGLFLDRGYTGHEHLLSVGLVHMNGRLYDPIMHRFLMPDNYVQDPYNTQNFNRYSYVLNNPLKYTDPSGEFFWFAVGIGALVGAISQALKPGANFGSILGGALIGAAAGMVGAGVGNAVAGGTFFGSQVATTLGFGSGFVSGFAGGFAGGFVGASGSAWLNGAGFGKGFGAGIKDGFISGLTGGMVNGITSGVRAAKKGLGFFNGVAKNESSISASGMAIPKKVPSVYAEGDFLDWTGTAAGPDGNSVFRTGTGTMEINYRITTTSVDWERTLSELGVTLQNVGDGMAVAGYGLTLSVVGAEIGAPLATVGNGISLGGSLLESLATTNLQPVGQSTGFFLLGKGGEVLINRIPYQTPFTREIMKQNWGLKLKIIEKSIGN